MIAGALFYYQRHWWRNRLLTRVRRLRQPKYLFGAIVGGLYFYWYIFRAWGRGGRSAGIALEHQDAAQGIASLLLLVAVVLAEPVNEIVLFGAVKGFNFFTLERGALVGE